MLNDLTKEEIAELNDLLEQLNKLNSFLKKLEKKK